MRIDYYKDPYELIPKFKNIGRLFYVYISRHTEEIRGVRVYKAVSTAMTKDDFMEEMQEHYTPSGIMAIMRFENYESMYESMPVPFDFSFVIEDDGRELDPDGTYISINGMPPEQLLIWNSYTKEYVNNIYINDEDNQALVAVHSFVGAKSSFYYPFWIVLNHIDEYYSQSDKLGIPDNNYPWAYSNDDPMEQIKQYVGETTSVFTKGHFYQRVPTTEYYTGAKWVEIDVGGGGGGGTSITGMKWTSGTSAGPTPIIEANDDITGLPIPVASTSESGVVTTIDQTFNGNKTFEGNLISNNEFVLNGIFKGKEGVNIVSSLPASGEAGQIVFLITP